MSRNVVIGVLLFAFGTLITSFNVYVGPVRYFAHRRRSGARSKFRFVSGVPFIGSLSLWFAALELKPMPYFSWLAVFISLFDVGGFHWLFGTVTFYSLRRPSVQNAEDARRSANERDA